MAGTLREELASLKIDRPDPEFSRQNGHRQIVGPPRWRRALRLLSWVLWLIPLGLLAGAGASPTASTTRSGRGPR